MRELLVVFVVALPVFVLVVRFLLLDLSLLVARLVVLALFGVAAGLLLVVDRAAATAVRTVDFVRMFGLFIVVGGLVVVVATAREGGDRARCSEAREFERAPAVEFHR